MLLRHSDRSPIAPIAASVWALSLISGCQQSAQAPPAKTAPAAAVSATESAASFPEPPPDDLDGGTLVEETWDAFSIQGLRIGFSRTTTVRLVEARRELVRTRNLLCTQMRREGQVVEQRMETTSWDTPDGAFVRFESRMSGGGSEAVAVGAVREGVLGMDVSILGRTESQKIPWAADWGGVFAPDQSLRRSPLKPGEKRTVRSFQPMLNVAADTRFAAADYETVDLPIGKVTLLKVNVIVDMKPQPLEAIYWVSDKGETLKAEYPGLGQSAVRTTKADALRLPGAQSFDLMVTSTVPLNGGLPDAPSTKRVVYRAHLKSGRIEGLFSECLSQRVKSIDERTVELTVLAIRPDQPASLEEAAIVPTAADQAPNNYIQSDDLEVAKLAAGVSPSETDAWKLACELEKFVDATIEHKNLTNVFATAAEVARSRAGDCTEHATLLAALCRARNIPARTAFGLLYVPRLKGCGYHMWNEVWIKDRWVPLDPTLGLGGIGADHIKLGDSNLAGGSPLAELMAVIHVFGRLELEVLSAE